MIHGASGYKNSGCRCDTCTDGQRDYQWRQDQARRARLEAGADEPAVHNAATYCNWGCRCDTCTAANSAACAARKARLRSTA